jgi:LmbE family N-acetylglucosaminyl deacetylase
VTGSGEEAAARAGDSGLPVGDLAATGQALTIDMDVPASALAIGAHPDDIEFGCGATLAKWAAAGCRIHHLVLTDGSKGSWDPEADLGELVAVRIDESRAAAAAIDGAPLTGLDADRVVFLGRVDGELVNGVDERRQVARVLRTTQSSVVLGHDPWRRYRLHPDHRSAGFLTLDAVVAARDPHFFADLGLPPHRPDAILLFEADVPNHVEDARGVEDVKIEALLRHRSQWRSTMGVTVPDEGKPLPPSERQAFAAKVRRQLGEHGLLAGLAAAEAFHRIADV